MPPHPSDRGVVFLSAHISIFSPLPLSRRDGYSKFGRTLHRSWPPSAARSASHGVPPQNHPSRRRRRSQRNARRRRILAISRPFHTSPHLTHSPHAFSLNTPAPHRSDSPHPMLATLALALLAALLASQFVPERQLVPVPVTRRKRAARARSRRLELNSEEDRLK